MVRFPDKVETERLLLRLPVARDARKFYKAVNESLPELRQWMPWAVEPYDLEKARSFCEVATKNANDGGRLQRSDRDQESSTHRRVLQSQGTGLGGPEVRDRLLVAHRGRWQRLRHRSGTRPHRTGF